MNSTNLSVMYVDGFDPKLLLQLLNSIAFITNCVATIRFTKMKKNVKLEINQSDGQNKNMNQLIAGHHTRGDRVRHSKNINSHNRSTHHMEIGHNSIRVYVSRDNNIY